MLLRKIYGPTQNNDGTWRIKTNEELEILNKKKNRKIYKITKITLSSTCNQNRCNKNCQKINGMENMFIKTSRKTKTEMV
jgi:hypothetical protein